MSDYRIYVACLASYNNGKLHGKWIDVGDVDDVWAGINEVLKTSPYPNVTIAEYHCSGGHDTRKTLSHSDRPESSIPCPECANRTAGFRQSYPSAEEWAIHDYEDPAGLISGMGENPSIAKLCERVAAIEECYSDEEAEGFALWLAECGFNREPDYSEFRDSYLGCWDTWQAFADEQADEMIEAHMPSGYGAKDHKAGFQWLSNYFDYEKFANDLQIEGCYSSERGSHGLHVWRND